MSNYFGLCQIISAWFFTKEKGQMSARARTPGEVRFALALHLAMSRLEARGSCRSVVHRAIGLENERRGLLRAREGLMTGPRHKRARQAGTPNVRLEHPVPVVALAALHFGDGNAVAAADVLLDFLSLNFESKSSSSAALCADGSMRVSLGDALGRALYDSNEETQREVRRRIERAVALVLHLDNIPRRDASAEILARVAAVGPEAALVIAKAVQTALVNLCGQVKAESCKPVQPYDEQDYFPSTLLPRTRAIFGIERSVHLINLLSKLSKTSQRRVRSACIAAFTAIATAAQSTGGAARLLWLVASVRTCELGSGGPAVNMFPSPSAAATDTRENSQV